VNLAPRLSPLQLGLDSLSDELRAPTRPSQGVNALHDGLRQADLRGFHTERRATHARSGRRYRFVGQSLHFSDTAYLTPLGDTAYIIGIGYGDKQMTYITKSGKVLTVKETNGKYFAWSSRALRWLPVKRSEVRS
jgi:hypothetical protein